MTSSNDKDRKRKSTSDKAEDTPSDSKAGSRDSKSKTRHRDEDRGNKSEDRVRDKAKRRREEDHSGSRDSRDRRYRSRSYERKRRRERRSPSRSPGRKRRDRSTSRSRERKKEKGNKDRDKDKKNERDTTTASAAPATARALAAMISARKMGVDLPLSTAIAGASGPASAATLNDPTRTTTEAAAIGMTGAAFTGPAVGMSSADLQAELEMRQRQERTRQFQEQRRVLEAQKMGSKSTYAGAALQYLGQVKSWSLEQEDDEDDSQHQSGQSEAVARPPADTPTLSLQEHAQSSTAPAEDEEDVDPLDAFMTSLSGQGASVPQADMYSAFGAGDKSKTAQYDPLGSTTITAEELTGARAAGDKAAWESDTDMDDDGKDGEEIDEQQLEADRQAFLRALRTDTIQKQPEQEQQQQPDAIEQQARPEAPVNDLKSADKSKKGVLLGRIFESDGDIMEEGERKRKDKSALEILQEQAKKKELKPVDHSTIEYLKIRRKLYIVPRALHNLSEKEVAARRDRLEIKVRGKACPAPIDDWEQTGLNDKILATLAKYSMTDPFPIQKQALPAIMAGRDMIGVAKTGSGKTLAFLLPMLRHIIDQEQQWPLVDGEGPIGMILAPARELAVQIFNEARKFAKPLGLRVVAVYGGAGIADQIGELKRGSHIVVCTPGRMIDILTMQAGKVVSLQRVSFVVMDEADRMFDMGFEPQIRMIIQNVRPDRQTVLFSATFPKQVESLARKTLQFPLEVIVGGRSVASESITQYAEIHDEGEKFMRLLQLLGVWYERGNVLIFVDTQQKCDNLFADLMRSGYPCLSLHGGMDQMDRDSTIHDFKARARTLMVATSVAGRGLDVADLVCVINYSCPNHLEDYVHRVGRTGRAGRKGTAYTFITPDEDQYAPLLFKALEQSKQQIPDDIRSAAEAFNQKVAAGEARKVSSGFGGKGFTFDDSEKNEQQRIAAASRKQYEIEQGLRTEEIDDGDSSGDEDTKQQQQQAKGSQQANLSQPILKLNVPAPASAPPAGPPVNPAIEAARKAIAEKLTAEGIGLPAGFMQAEIKWDALEKVKALAASLGVGPKAGTNEGVAPAAAGMAQVDPKDALARARAFADQLAAQANATKGPDDADVFEDEVIINDYPQQARWRVTHRETIRDLQERTECNVINKGRYCPPGVDPPEGERKLFLLIEGQTEVAVKYAKRELQRLLDEETLKASSKPSFGRYQVV